MDAWYSIITHTGPAPDQLPELAASGRPLVVELDLRGSENTIPGVRGQLDVRAAVSNGIRVCRCTG